MPTPFPLDKGPRAAKARAVVFGRLVGGLATASFIAAYVLRYSVDDDRIPRLLR